MRKLKKKLMCADCREMFDIDDDFNSSTPVCKECMKKFEWSEKRGLIRINRSNAILGTVEDSVFLVERTIESMVPSKRLPPDEKRFELLIEIAIHDFFTKIGNIANEMFLNNKEIRSVIVCGSSAEEFLKRSYLNDKLTVDDDEYHITWG